MSCGRLAQRGDGSIADRSVAIARSVSQAARGCERVVWLIGADGRSGGVCETCCERRVLYSSRWNEQSSMTQRHTVFESLGGAAQRCCACDLRSIGQVGQLGCRRR